MQLHYAEKAGKPQCIFLHAEILAILRAKGKRIHRMTIERYSEDGIPMPSAPCPICLLAIKEAGIKHIQHT